MGREYQGGLKMIKEYLGSCVINPFNSTEELQIIVEDAKEITKQKFMENCSISKEIKGNMKMFPNDYIFYKYEDIYFFTHSAIEYFYR